MIRGIQLGVEIRSLATTAVEEDLTGGPDEFRIIYAGVHPARENLVISIWGQVREVEPQNRHPRADLSR